MIVFFILKSFYRFFDYLRGVKLFIIINLCGGKCRNIPRIGKGVIWKYPPHQNIILGKNVYIGPYSYIDVPSYASLNIGSSTRLTLGVVLAANNNIFIGEDVLIAEYCSIRDSEHLYAIDKKINAQGLKTGKIEIRNDVWIGKSSLILGNVLIENGCIIGAGAFVKDMKCLEYTINVGTPAIVLKKRKY